MVAKVYGKTTIAAFDGDRQKHTAVFVKPNQSVCVIRSQMFQGVRKDNGKSWNRWEDVSSYGLFRSSAGNLVPFYKNGKRWDGLLANQAFLPLGPQPTWRSVSESEVIYREYVEKELGIKGFEDVYPFAAAKDLTYQNLPTTIRNFYRANSAIDFTLRAFGKSRYRKDLVKAVAKSPTEFFIAIAYEFRGLVPTDWLVNFLRLEHTLNADTNLLPNMNLRGLRDILKQIDPKSYRHLLTEPIGDLRVYGLRDVLERFRIGQRGTGYAPIVVPPNRFRSWGQLHDELIGHRATHAIFEQYHGEIKPTKLAEKLDGLQLPNGMQFIVPKHTKELIDYGKEMRNCIGSYGSDAMKGSSIFMAVLDGDKMIANIQVVGNTLRQLLGKCNQPLPAGQRQIIEHVLMNEGNVKVPGNYWGSGEFL